ncbi:MAG: CotH kinase family protein [Myxococcota bacterium]
MLLALLACRHSSELDLGEPDTTDPAATAPAPAAFDRDAVLDVRLTLDDEDWEELRTEERNPLEMFAGDCLAEEWPNPYDWFHAEVEIDGERLHDVGVHKKGFFGSVSETRPSMVVRLDKYEDDQAFRGTPRLTLNNAQQDPTLLRTCLAYDTFLALGIPAPACGFANVTVNGDDLGVYVNVESVDEVFLARIGSPEASMFEGAVSDFREGWLGTFEPETDESGLADLVPLTDALEVGDDELFDALEPVLDVDAFYRFWAAEMLTAHWDGYAANTNNFHVYVDPADGRARFIPWGTDAAWWPGVESAVIANSMLTARLLGTSEGRERYADALRDVLADFDEDALVEEAERAQELIGGDDDGFRELKRTIKGRRETLEEALDGGIEDVSALRDPPCLIPTGSVEATFTVEWGSYPSGSPAGAGDFTVVYAGDAIPVSDVYSLAGESDGQGLLVVIGTAGADTYVAPYVVFDPDDLEPGAALDVDWDEVAGSLLYNGPDTGGQWTEAAWLGEGTLALEDAANTDGASLSGTLTAELFTLGW